MWSRCRVGHQDRHDILNVSTSPWPTSDMYVYDWWMYGGQNLDRWQEYCPGQDVISRALDDEGVWERHESALFVDILKHGLPDPAPVYDFGCQLGWYSALADRLGYPVVACDVNSENVALTRLNAPDADVFLGAVDKDCKPIWPQRMRCVKIDIEGAEQWAVRMIEPSLEYALIDYILMEVSPVFHDGYPALMERICSYGYDPWLIPSNDRDCPSRFDKEPLRALTHSPTLDLATVPGMHQVDVMFARKP